MAAQDKSTYEIFEIRSNDGTKTVDLSGGIVNFSYFENVLSPMVTAQALIVNTGNVVRDEDDDVSSVYNGLPLNGGEKVSIKIPATGEGPGIEFTEQNDNELYVASITNVLIDAERESFTLNLVSREAITNETSRIGKKFPSTEPISDSVKEIIKNYLLSDKDVDIDETQNPYGFIGNMKKPFTTLTWLATKSVALCNVSGGSATAGYFFFETYLGYHFRSVDSLINQDPFPVEYTYSPGVVDSQDPMKDYKILDFSTMRNQKLIENLEKGAYCTYRMYYNPLNSTFTTPQQGEFKVSQYSKNMENLGRDFEILLPPVNKTKKSLGNVPSRYMTGVLDFGTLERKGSRARAKNADPMEYHSQAMMRYNTIFTQILSATIPLNTQLTAGTIIKLNFAKITADKTKVRDDEQSGLYMIKELVHYYDNKGSFTKLKLIRDTTGKKDK